MLLLLLLLLLLLCLPVRLDSVTALALITTLKQLAAGTPAAASNTLTPPAVDLAEQGLPLQTFDPSTPLVSTSERLATTSAAPTAAAEGCPASSMPMRPGCTIICTIHQPQSKIFHLFDQLLLLQAGCMVYQGPAAGALQHYAHMGFPCPGERQSRATACSKDLLLLSVCLECVLTQRHGRMAQVSRYRMSLMPPQYLITHGVFSHRKPCLGPAQAHRIGQRPEDCRVVLQLFRAVSTNPLQIGRDSTHSQEDSQLHVTAVTTPPTAYLSSISRAQATPRGNRQGQAARGLKPPISPRSAKHLLKTPPPEDPELGWPGPPVSPRPFSTTITLHRNSMRLPPPTASNPATNKLQPGKTHREPQTHNAPRAPIRAPAAAATPAAAHSGCSTCSRAPHPTFTCP
jgi:hypothetical protein